MTTASAGTPIDSRASSGRSQLPVWRAVLREQLRATGFVLRRPAQIAAALAIFATIVITLRIVSRGLTFDLDAEPSPVFGLVGALLPIAVWFSDERFGPGFLWTLPVDRRQHALTKVFAGWLWLMGGVALSLLWLVAITIASGGDVLPAETIHLLNAPLLRSGDVDPESLRRMTWDPGFLIGLVPFTAATATYLIASAFWLGTRYPIRWLIGAVLAISLTVVATDIASSQLRMDWLATAPERGVKWLVESPYGIDALLTAQTATLDSGMRTPTGERVSVWMAEPDLGHWGGATLLWSGIGLVALWVAASRHREQRRG